ncbi:MAG: hypothetical protein OWT28_02525 [Firmicutes bacterium]|nr:hypothetical protein [Bacillota bacterium]
MKIYLNDQGVERFLKEKRWSGRDLARKLGVAPSTISRMRRHERSVGGYVMSGLMEITKGYLTCEELFDAKSNDDSSLQTLLHICGVRQGVRE